MDMPDEAWSTLFALPSCKCAYVCAMRREAGIGHGRLRWGRSTPSCVLRVLRIQDTRYAGLRAAYRIHGKGMNTNTSASIERGEWGSTPPL